MPGGNFGDDLNDLIWQKIFPNILELRNDCIVYGIGTILGGKEYNNNTKIVLGSGLGYKKINPLSTQWDIQWVRGQLSAQALGIDKSFALGDGALLWPELNTTLQTGNAIGFIPHHATWSSYDWQLIAEQSNLKIINPKNTPVQVANDIRQCNRVITESLHGAIFADCLQIPWHPIVLSYRFNNFKWKDWLSIYNLPFKPSVIPTPLSNSISRIKSVKNLCAMTFLSNNDTRYNKLRAIKMSSEQDRQSVISILNTISTNESLFMKSSATSLDFLRNNLYSACNRFAKKYNLRFVV